MRRGCGVLVLMVVFTTALAGCQELPEPTADLPVLQRVGLSSPFHIDRIYKSMEGPSAEARFRLGSGATELLWITGYRTEVADEAGRPSEALAEFMCHNNVDFDAALHSRRFGLERPVNFGRVFTVSQGVFEIDLPDGFGIPVFSDEELTVYTMVLNHNREDAEVTVRHRITIDYVRDADARGRLRPLYPTFAPVMALVAGDDGYYGLESEPASHQEGASCAPGMVAPNAPQATRYYRDPEGRVFTQHWVVPPGEERRRTLVTRILNVPFDTTLHAIAAHLHPFAQSLELRDLERGETLFRARARAPERGVGLAGVEAFSSAEGIPVFRDRDYEVVSVYDNPTGVDQDAMAVFFAYYYDAEMDRRLDAVRAELARTEAAGGI